MTLEQLTELFKWMTIINIAMLAFSVVLVTTLRKMICKMHGKMFGINEDKISTIMYCYIGAYKILMITFNIVPYIALVILK